MDSLTGRVRAATPRCGPRPVIKRATQPLKVAVDASRGFDGAQTGTERYAASLIHALAERSDLDLRLYLRRPATRPLPPGLPFRVLRAPRLWTHTRFAAALALDDSDVAFVPAHVSPRFTRGPVVVTIHDLGHRHWPAAHTASQRRYLEWGARHHAARATRIVVDSHATAEDLRLLYDVDPARIVHAPLGVGPDLRPPSAAEKESARARIGLDADAPFLLHVGTLQPRKNLLRLIESFARMQESSPRLHLVLAGGSGWGSEDLPAHARSLGVADRLLLPGYVEERNLPGLYGAAAAVVVPSLHEGFGLPALEAMACGAPVACSNRSSLPEVVKGAGLLFDPLDISEMSSQIMRILEECELRSQLIAAGLVRARSFTWARTAEAVATALHDAAETAKRGRARV